MEWNLLAALSLTSAFVLGAVAVTVIVVVSVSLVMLNYGALWFQAYMSGADVSLVSLIGMSFRQVQPRMIVAAKIMGRFNLMTFSDPGDTVRSLMGAALMGVGGVMALGCTIGQAVTGVSTLAIGSFLTFAAIIAGGIYGLHHCRVTI